MEKDQPDQGQHLRLMAATAASSAALTLMVEDRPAAAAVVERGWVQTWLADQARQERAVFQITASEPRVSVNLPSDVNISQLEVLIDAQPVQPTLKNGNGVNGNGVIVDWPSTDGIHVLELRYPYLDRGRRGWTVPLDVPAFGDDVRLRRVYWQLIVPRDQHLITSSSSLNPEFHWLWERLHWSRQSLLDQADLETWTGALHESPVPDSMNVYLFSMIGAGPSLEAWVARRSTIVFASSLMVLAVVILAYYAPWVRRPQALAATGVALAVLALAYPEPAIVLGQAAVLGILLALGSALLHHRMRQGGDELSRPQPSSIVERSSTDVLYRPPPGGSPSSTATAALSMEHPSSGSQVR